MTAVPASVT